MLGRYEYQKGNIEAALHVFDGIDIAIVTPKMKLSLVQKGEPRKRNSYSFADPPLSIHVVGLLLEAIYLKSKSLQLLERYKGTLFLRCMVPYVCSYTILKYSAITRIYN